MTVSVNQIRKTFLDYFAKQGHKVVPSSSLVPDNDPTLMFTNSGMVQFKNILAGNETRDYTRATTAQKSVRAGGKHNDLDSVGYDVRHHTFFEMLGNFSFGDYFNDYAIPYAWELLTKEFGLPKEKLAVTIYHNDDEAHDIWKKVSGLPEDRIIRIATKDNFWQMGDTGPCGPCSEIFYDHGPEVWGGLPGTPEEDGDRFIEIWNLVFDQFEDLPDGSRINLKRPSIDTGMGLERIAAILQGVHSNFETDMFQHLIKAIADIANTDPNGPLKASHNVVADHLRAICFLIADGVLPSNEGRGYVLRRIMRRAMRHAYLLGVKEQMIYKLLPTLQQEMGEAYPELYARENLIRETIAIEEERFGRTLDKGMRLLDDEIGKLASGDKLSGETAFRLYDTYGFPLDLTQDALKNKGIEVDVEGFDACMEKQKAEARKNWAGSGDEWIATVWYGIQDKCGATEFLGYSTLKADAEVTALVQDNAEVKEVRDGKFELVANQTPFYGECGGQVGDVGMIIGKNFSADVVDCKRKLNGIFVHICVLKSGSIKTGDVANFAVNAENRARICANHSVTHLAHKALKQVLGDHVAQKGSMVEADRMRFDISHPKQITAAELREVERIVNEQIRQDLTVSTVIMNKDEAVKLGAMALFDEKYAEDVRVVTMGDEACPFSRELCGGTHVQHTGNIGYFHILNESAVAAGVRRLECVTGAGADAYVCQVEEKLRHVAASLKTNVNDLENRIAGMLEERKKLENEIFNLKKNLVGGRSSAKDEVENINGVKFVGKLVPDTHPKELKAFVDDILQNLGSGVALLCSDKDGKASVVAGVSSDLTGKYNAVDLVRAAAVILGGNGGGGRPDMAQAGGADVTKINDAINKVRSLI